MPEQTTDPEPQGVDQETLQALKLLNSGRLAFRESRHGEALADLHLACDQFMVLGDRAHVAEVSNDIGVVYTVLKRWDEAENSLNEAHNLFTKLQDYNGEAQSLANLGSMCRDHGDFQQAAATLQLAVDKFRLLGDDERRSMTLKLLSRVRLRQFRLMQAVAAYEAALLCEPNPSLFQRLLRRLFALPLRIMRA